MCEVDKAILVSQQLTVLQVLPALEGGGVERGTLEVATYLVKRGHRSLVMSAGGRLVKQLVAEGSQHLCWPIGLKSLRTLFLIRALRRLFVEERVDVVHVRSRLPAWICYLAWRGMPAARRPRLVTTAHGFYSPGPYSAVMTRGETVIAVSDAVATYLQDNYGALDPALLRVIPRGVDPSRYHPTYQPSSDWLLRWQTQYPQLVHRRLLVLAGRLTRLKGQHDFIRLIGALRQEFPDIHGLIVGEADARHQPYLAELKAAVAAQGLTEYITFTGHRQDLREVFSVSALVLSLSTQPEAFGRTVLEALALGVPVVAHATGGVEEQLLAMFPAGRVRPGDQQGLLVACAGVLRERPRPAALPEKFIVDHMLASTLAIYEEMAATRLEGEHLAYAQ